MKKKFLGRVLTMLLVASMVFTLLPAPAIAAGNWWWNNDEYTEEAVPTATTDDYDRILHLDCGRKYFTKDWIIALMTEAKAAGYNQIQLAFGNKGLRFLLDNMSLTVNGTTYNSQQVSDAIHTGNETYYDFPVDELTETEMNDILTAAQTIGIDVIPLFNTPFHMEAVITAMEELGITDSYFTKVDGTPERGCLNLSNEAAVNFVKALMQKYVNYFSGKNCKYFSFGADEYTGGWNDTFYSYAGEIASMIKTAQMTPRVFNDSYRDGSTTYIDGVDQVCYWYTGYWGNMYSSAATLKAAGKQLINTNKDYYYVVSKEQIKEWSSPQIIQYVFSGPYDEATWINKANQFNRDTFNNWAGINYASVSSDGSMFCIWCDNPGAKDETQIAKETRMILRVMAARMQNSYDYQDADVLVDGGFDADGRIYHKDIKDNKDIKEINITVGQTHTETIDGNHPGPYEIAKPDIATVTGKVIPGTTATQTLGDMYEVYYYNGYQSATGVISDGKGNYLKISNDNASCVNTNDITEATRFKFTRIKSSEKSNTIQIDDRRSNYDTFYLEKSGSNVAVSATNATWIVGTGSNFCIKRSNGYDYDCLVFADGNWKCALNDWSHAGYLYEVNTDTTSTADKTELTFTGLKRGDTEVTIGTTKYLIHVSEAQLSDNRICINYYITNHRVEDENDNTSRWVSAGEGNINSDKGVAIEELIALTGTDTHTSKPTKFYKATAQSGNNIQTDAGWTNKIAAGDNCAKLRYWNNTWSVCDASGQWHDVVGKTAEFDPETQLSNGAAETNTGYAAITAYYGQQTDVTDEITTYATDWGGTIPGAQDLGGEYALLDFAVKYQSGDRTPSKFATSKTIVYNAKGDKDYAYSENGNTRIVKDLFVENTEGYEVYMITVTKNNNALPTADTALSSSTKISYKTADTDVSSNDEMVVWVDKEEDLGYFNSADKQYPGYKVGGDPIVSAIYVAQQSAYLVTYYVRAVSKDQLQVNYIDLATNKPFYHYGINVRGTTTFSKDIALNTDTADSWKGNLVNGTVKNDKDKDQTVSADLSTMPEIGAEYRHVAYTCDHIQLSADRKTLDLYYKFNNTVTFVADFGLPITINKGDLSETLNNAGVEITEVKAAGVNHGAVEINEDVVTYTPDKRFVADENGESFTLTYTGTNVQETGSEGKVAYRVNILPASNVLYEENFLTQSGESGLSWTQGTPAELGSQETQKVGDTTHTYNVFGRDTAYDNVTGELGAWTADGLVAGQGATKDLSTEFYGNGFDLIGNCGPDTGRVFLFISGANQIKLVDVDTRYSGNTLNQVPLAHVMLGQEANYQVKVSAAGLKATDATSASYSLSGAATYASDYAVGGYDADLYNVLAENGLTMADVEYVKVESVPAATTRSAASFYALDTADVGGTVTHEAGTHVEIDGFRVYRSSANNTNYPKSEQDVRYLNILDAVDSFTAFVEGSAADSEWKARDKYESAGGPQNEIYLRETNGENSAIAFKTEIGEVVQISARAVENNKPATLVVNGVATVIETNTEMYYTFTPDENGIVTIKNTGKGMLALGNLKIKKGTQVAALSEEDYPAAIALLSLNAAPETPDEGFNPAINAKVTTTRFIRSKVVTLTVSASSDVAVLEVNGVELRPTNSWLVKMGWSDTYTYILTEKVPKSETKTYEIVGYRADGAASAPIVVESK